jgi:tetratricopeptide (TPR) repeat protein
LGVSVWISFSLRTFGEQVYEVNGKQLTEQEFQSAKLTNQGILLLRQNQNKAAVEIFAQALQLAPLVATTHIAYALALGKLNKIDMAISELKQAIQLAPNEPNAWLYLGGIYQTNGQLDLAIPAFTEFINRFPTNPDAPKIRMMVQGLIKENASRPLGQSVVRSEEQSIPRSLGSESSNASVKQVIADEKSKPDDYFLETTAQGVYRWPASSMPIKVYINSSAGVPFYKNEYGEILRRAFTDWAKLSEGRVQFAFVRESADADIECIWTNNREHLADAAEGGEARVSVIEKRIVHAKVTLLTVPLVAEIPLTDNLIRSLCLHEIGHSLGLRGHSRNPDDIMFFSERKTDDFPELSKRDKNTLLRLYSDSPS